MRKMVHGHWNGEIFVWWIAFFFHLFVYFVASLMSSFFKAKKNNDTFNEWKLIKKFYCVNSTVNNETTIKKREENKNTSTHTHKWENIKRKIRKFHYIIMCFYCNLLTAHNRATQWWPKCNFNNKNTKTTKLGVKLWWKTF